MWKPTYLPVPWKASITSMRYDPTCELRYPVDLSKRGAFQQLLCKRAFSQVPQPQDVLRSSPWFGYWSLDPWLRLLDMQLPRPSGRG